MDKAGLARRSRFRSTVSGVHITYLEASLWTSRGDYGTFSICISLIQPTFLDTRLPSFTTFALDIVGWMTDLHQMKRYAIVGTPTPGDGWSSYFDSWRTEDTQVPAYSEPRIVDDESHPDLGNLRFNMDMEVDWTMDMQSPYVGAAMHHHGSNVNGKTRLNVAHPDYQRHGLQRHDVDAWQRPWLVQANDDVLGPLRQIQIGAGVPVSTDPQRNRDSRTGNQAHDAHAHAQAYAQANLHPHSGLGVRRALKVKVSDNGHRWETRLLRCPPHHCPPFAS